MHRLLLFFTLALYASLAVAQPSSQPNFLWLIAEDFGPHLGCDGTAEVSTPVLDALAAKGMRFTRFYTTAPVCSASRSAFMTGMYQTTIGAQNHRSHRGDGFQLPAGVQVLTDWLREPGYHTANIVKLPDDIDFKGTGKTDWNFKTDDKPFDSARWADLKTHQPFYAQVNFHETHRVNRAPKHADPAKVELPPYYPDHPITRQDWAEYLDAATELDRKIGTIIAALKTDGLADDTLIVFFGDNGQSHVRGKQFCYEEGHLVPLLMHWPKNFPPPAHFQRGTVDSRMLQGIDLNATTLDLAGVRKPAKMQGRIFLGDRCEPDQRYVFGHRDRCDMTVMRLRSVRDERFRYLRNFTPWVPFLAYNEYKTLQYPVWTLLPKLQAEGKLTPPQEFLCQPTRPAEELYDLQNDPWELHNLANSPQPEPRAALQRLRGVLEKWIEETNDQGRRFETLAELQQADPRFVAARDWRPEPGTKQAAEAAALRAAAKDQPATPSPTSPKKKRKDANQ